MHSSKRGWKQGHINGALKQRLKDDGQAEQKHTSLRHQFSMNDQHRHQRRRHCCHFSRKFLPQFDGWRRYTQTWAKKDLKRRWRRYMQFPVWLSNGLSCQMSMDPRGGKRFSMPEQHGAKDGLGCELQGPNIPAPDRGDKIAVQESHLSDGMHFVQKVMLKEIATW